MKRSFLLWSLIALSAYVHAQGERGAVPEAFERALQLIHAFSGSGDQLQRAMALAKELSISHPNGGYSQTLQAEALSTWQLDQQGRPPALVAQIIHLTDEAIRVNPKLAQAYVARARALLRSSDYENANGAIDQALKLAPNLNGALFLRAELFRRTQRVSDAEVWYLRFIEATPDNPRKSNGYYWLGKAYQDAAPRQPDQRSALLSKARAAYERMLELDPNGAWKNVNFAIFLNGDVGDFEAAERYAQKALGIMEFPMARYHLAIARYQKLSAPKQAMDDRAFHQEVQKIAESTGISLEKALDFVGCCAPMSDRLQAVRARLSKGSK